jgi:hypothetical protein
MTGKAAAVPMAVAYVCKDQAEKRAFRTNAIGVVEGSRGLPVRCGAEEDKNTHRAVGRFSRRPGVYEVQCTCLAKIVEWALDGTVHSGHSFGIAAPGP